MPQEAYNHQKQASMGAAEPQPAHSTEIAHVLFMDIVAYSKLPMGQQERLLEELQEVVRHTAEFARASIEDQLIRLPTGDGMALVFFRDPEAPVRCALELSRALCEHPEIKLRIGVHTGPVYRVADINANLNVAGGGINIAQRVMDCGDPGHILVSKATADVLREVGGWNQSLKDLGELKVKHGLRLHLFELSKQEAGRWVRSKQLRLIRARRLRRMLAMMLAVVVVAGVLSAWLIYSRKRGSNPPGPTQGASVAVLPFVDLSPQKDQEYFSDGLAEELINDLAQTQGLRVVARTSSFQFKGKSDDLRVIGEKLNAANILEGSVRKQGNRVRITGQLIKTSDGYHLWSETYDAEMNDIFAVQEQIARSVAGSLKLTLLGGPPPGPPNRSENAEAYDAYLQGRYFAELQGKENLQRAVGYYERATKLDPHYVPAWTGLAEVYKWQAGRDLLEKGETREEGFRKARKAVSRALTLDPDSAEANAIMASIQMLYDWDWQGADVSLKRAMALAPDKPKVLRYAAVLAGIMGDQEHAIVLDRHLIALDPLDPSAQIYFGDHSWYAGRLDEAVAAYRKALELTPGYQGAHHGLALIYLQQGKSREALTEAQREPHPLYRLQGLTLVYRATGRDKESDAALEELIGKFQGESDFQIAEVYGFQGDRERTFQWLERAYVQRDPGLPFVKGDPAFEKNKDDPRYAALLKKMRLPL